MSMRIEQEELLAMLERALRAQVPEAGGASSDAVVSADDLARASRWLLTAEQLGLGSFGVGMLVRELERLGAAPGGEAPASADDDRRAPAAPVIDAARIPGPIALAVGVRRLLETSREHAISAVSVENVGALGVLGLAARTVAEEGLLALFCARAPAAVAPWGGRSAAIGTNPVALAAPRRHGAPLVLDYATSSISMAALRTAAAAGMQLDAPGGFTADGIPTTDAADVRTIAPDSRIASLTGLAVELLTRGTTSQRPAPSSSSRSALLIAIDPRGFGAESFPDSVADLAAGWAAAGGHVPRRFDDLGDPSASADGFVDVDPAALEALRRFAGVGRASDAGDEGSEG